MSSIQLITTNKWRYHTDIHKILSSIPEIVKERTWILTNWEGNKYPKGYNVENQRIEIDGKDLLKIFDKKFQLIWGVLTGGNDNILKSKQMPYAEFNENVWQPFYEIQNEYADIEILSWDSSYTLISSSEEYILDFIKNKIGINTVFDTDCLKIVNEFYKGMTVNEMLFQSGFEKDFYKAKRKKNSNEMKNILLAIGLSQDTIDRIIEDSL